MKRKLWVLSISLLCFLLALVNNSCKKSVDFSKPTISTDPATAITTSGATVGGSISSDGGAAVTDRGIFLRTNSSTYGTKVSLGSGQGSFVVTLDTLRDNTTYYFQSFAINSVATVLGSELSFMTLRKPKVPTVFVLSASMITESSALVGGNITDDGGTAVTQRGIYFGTSPAPETSGTQIVLGSGTGSFTTSLPGLSANTTYYFKPFAVNVVGKALGRELTLTTSSAGGCLNCTTGTITDIGNNTYKTIVIGTQTWMAENLRTPSFANGNLIPTTGYTIDYSTETSPKYQWSSVCSEALTYGRLYTWYAVTDSRGLCPTGWHIPADAEFQTLSDFLGGDLLSGGKLKSTGTTDVGDGLYLSPNTGATNESGFSALPSTYVDSNCKCNSCSDTQNNPNGSSFWTVTEVNSLSASTWHLGSKSTGFSNSGGSAPKSFGMAVRCVKN